MAHRNTSAIANSTTVHKYLRRLPLYRALLAVCILSLITAVVMTTITRSEHQASFVRADERHLLRSKLDRHRSGGTGTDLRGVNSTGRRLVSVQLQGRTGNNMFGYAAMISVALRYNLTPVYLPHHFLRYAFSLSASSFTSNRGFDVWRRFHELRPCAYDDRIERMNVLSKHDDGMLLSKEIEISNVGLGLINDVDMTPTRSTRPSIPRQSEIILHPDAPAKNTSSPQQKSQAVDILRLDMLELCGYFQSWRYFDEESKRIRAEFAFRDEYVKTARRFVTRHISRLLGNTTRRSDVILVGVHVRVGDMASNDSARFGYVVADAAYVVRAVRFFQNRFVDEEQRRRLMFVLSTDDRDWYDKRLRQYVRRLGSPVVLVGLSHRGFTDLHDMAVLVSCNHTIITVGSFGWWAAYLTGGITVYYKNFPRPNSTLAFGFDASDYYPPTWIPM